MDSDSATFDAAVLRYKQAGIRRRAALDAEETALLAVEAAKAELQLAEEEYEDAGNLILDLIEAR